MLEIYSSMRKYHSFHFIFLVGFLLFGKPNNSLAQNYFSASQEEFGKSRIQTKRFEWITLKSNNFEFNYYRGGDKLANNAAKIAEGEYDRITEILGYTPFTSMKIFLYNSPKDLAQSNIGLTAPTDLDGSILNLAKSRVQIAYTGNDEVFRQMLVQQMAKLFVYDMLYGGSLKEVLQSSFLLTVPKWYMSGIAAYIAGKNEKQEELDKMRVAIIKNRDKKLNSLDGQEAEIVGQSIWNYIVVKYGKDNISNILNLTRIIRTEESSITSTLGLSYHRFLKEWENYYVNSLYVQQNTAEANSPQSPAEANPSNQKTDTSPKSTLILEPGEVDTDHYEFENESLIKALVINETKKVEISGDSSQNKDNNSPKIKLKAPKAYQNSIIANDVKSEFLIDPVRRLGMKNTLIMNDLLENHQFKLGLFITPTLRNHDVNLSYQNNTKKTDWGIDIARRSISLSELDDRSLYLFRPLNINTPAATVLSIDRRLYYNRFSFFFSHPFSENLKLIVSPNLISTADIDVADLGKKNLISAYLGFRTELVFDNTKPLINKSLVGTRAKIRFEKENSLNSVKENFQRLNIDARHYQQLFGHLIVATRLSYSRSVGKSPKVTILGGVENNVNRNITETNGQSEGVPRDLRDILFYDFAGNLRGFDFAKLYGTSHLLGNVELRLPFASITSESSMTSSFMQNLQLVGFGDVGTAWFGNKGPFNRQNSLNTSVVGGGDNPFKAVVTNFKNPFLFGYGMGIRSTILGYYVKADYAWGIEDRTVSKPKFYVSLGYDF